MDIGNLQLGIQIDGLSQFDALERRLHTIQSGPTIRVNIDEGAARQRLNALLADTQRLAMGGHAIKVTADITRAQADIRTLNAEMSGLTGRTSTIRVNADTSQADRAISNLNSSLNSMVAGGIGAAGGLVIAKGFGEAADAVIGFNGKLEQTRVAFTHALGSASAADQFIGTMKDFAKTTPFQFEDVTKYAQRLMGVGVAAQSITHDLSAMGDAVAGVGGGTDQLDHVVLAMGQVRNSAHLMSQDMNQLSQVLPVWDILAKKMGVSQEIAREMVKDGKISGQQGYQTILAGMQGRYGGLMEAQSKTFLGRVSNFKDAFTMNLADLGKPLFDDANAGLDKMAAAINSDKFKALATGLVQDIHNVATFAGDAAEMLGKVPTPLVQAAIHMAELVVGIKAATIAMNAFGASRTAAGFGGGGGVVAAGGVLGAQEVDKRLLEYASNDVAGQQESRYKQSGLTAADALLDARNRVKQMQNANKDASFLGIPNPDIPGFGRLLPTGLSIGGNRIGGTSYSDAEIQGLQQWIALKEKELGITKEIAVAAQPSPFTGAVLEPEISAKSVGLVLAERERQAGLQSDAQKATGYGASQEIVQRAIYGMTGRGDEATKDQVERAKGELRDLESAYKHAQDEIKKGWEKAQEEIKKGWESASQAIGKIDLSQSFSGLSSAATGIAETRAELAKLGQTNVHLDALAGITARWKEIADAEKHAADEYNGFMLLLNGTNQRIGVLDSFKKQVDESLAAAQDAATRGVATNDQMTLLQNADSIYANIAQTRTGLQANATTDVLGISKSLPDLLTADKKMRDLAADYGGGKGLLVKVNAEVDAAQTAINALVKDREMTVVVKMVDAAGSPVTLPASGTAAGPPAPSGAASGTVAGGGTAGRTIYPGGSSPYDEPQNSGGGGPGSPGQYRAMSFDEWNRLTGKYQGSPLTGNRSAYDSFNRGAQDANIDPYLAAATMAQESSFGADPNGQGTANLNVNNFIGMGKNTRPWGRSGGSGVAATDQGPGNYASYASLYEQVQDLAAWIREMNPDALASGDVAGSFNRYSASPAASPMKAQLYQQFSSGAPAGGGGGGGSTITPSVPQGANTRVSLTMPTPDPGAGANIDVAAMRARAQELAGNAYVYGGGHSANDAGGFDCSGYVMEVLRAGGVSVPWTDAGGLYKWAQTDQGQRLLDAAGIQLGFLNPGAGGKNEHVAVNIGGDWFEDGGVRGNAGPSPNAAQGLNTFVGTPRAIASGATGRNPDGPLAYARRAADAPIPSDATQRNGDAPIYADPSQRRADAPINGRVPESLTHTPAEFVGQIRDLNAALKGLTQSSLQGYGGFSQRFATYAQSSYRAQLGPGREREADNTAKYASGNFDIRFAEALKAAQDPSANLAANYAKIREVGGPIAENAIKWLGAQQKINGATAETKAAQAEIVLIDAAAFARNRARQAEDRQIAAAQRAQARADQQADRSRTRGQTLTTRSIEDQRRAVEQRWKIEQQGIEATRRATDTAWTAETRRTQDRQRDLQWRQTLRRTGLDDQLYSLQKDQRETGYQRTSQEQVVAASVKGADTNAQAGALAASLSMMHEADLATRDANVKAIDDLQEQIRLEGRKADQERYDLETQTIAATRAHEDEVARIEERSRLLQASQASSQETWASLDRQRQRAQEDEAFGIEGNRLARQQATEDAATALAEQRQMEDAADEDRKRALQETIDKNGELIKGWQDFQSLIDAALSEWQTKAQSLGVAAAGDPGSPDTSGNSTFIKRLGRAGGGMVDASGFAIVGDGPHGEITPYTEVVHAPGKMITPIRNLARSGGGTTVNMGDINVEGGDIEAILAQVRREQAMQLAALERRLRQSPFDTKRSQGVA